MKMLELLFSAKWELTFIDSQAFRDVGRALLLDQCAFHTFFSYWPIFFSSFFFFHTWSGHRRNCQNVCLGNIFANFLIFLHIRTVFVKICIISVKSVRCIFLSTKYTNYHCHPRSRLKIHEKTICFKRYPVGGINHAA